MKTRILLLPILSIVLAPVLLGGCYTMISQSVYERPDIQRPERSVIIERPAPAREVNSSQQDSVAAETDQQGLGSEKDVAGQNYDDQYDTRSPGINSYYGWPEPYPYDSWRYPPGWYGSYIWDPYIFTPHLHMGFMYNTWDPFYRHDPWAFGYNSWYYDPWYSPYYAMYDPWYYNSYDPWYYRGYDYDYGYYGNYGGGGGGGGDGRHDGVAQGPRKIRLDRLAGFGAFANTRGVYAPDNSVSGNTAAGAGGAVQVNRRTARDGFGIISTRRSAPTEVTGKTTAETVTAPVKRTPAQGNPPVRQRTLPGVMTRRIKDSESYVITIPNDDSGRPVIQYRDQQTQSDYQKDIRISRENNNEKTVNRSVPPQNNTPAERVDTSRSTIPSRDTGRTAPSYTPPSSGSSAPSSTPPSYTPPSSGSSAPSYTPRTGGGSSSGTQSRPSDSRSGQRRR